jgi:hypothetical protein
MLSFQPHMVALACQSGRPGGIVRLYSDVDIKNKGKYLRGINASYPNMQSFVFQS